MFIREGQGVRAVHPVRLSGNFALQDFPDCLLRWLTQCQGLVVDPEMALLHVLQDGMQIRHPAAFA